MKRFSSGASSTLSLGDTDDEFEDERAASIKVESKLQIVIKNLDKEIKARRGTSVYFRSCWGYSISWENRLTNESLCY